MARRSFSDDQVIRANHRAQSRLNRQAQECEEMPDGEVARALFRLASRSINPFGSLCEEKHPSGLNEVQRAVADKLVEAEEEFGGAAVHRMFFMAQFGAQYSLIAGLMGQVEMLRALIYGDDYDAAAEVQHG